MMRVLTKKIVKTVIKPIPISAYQLLTRKKVIGLVYHTVSDRPLYHIKHLCPYKSPEMFESDLIYLRKSFNLISSQQLIEQQSLKTKILPNSIILTFDDGYSECFSVARPLLLKYEIPCIFFITTDFIDNKNMFYRNKISLCIEKINTCENLERLDFFRNINSTFGLSINTKMSFFQWIKSLNYSDKDIIDKICNLLGINIKQYMINHRPYLSSEEIRFLAGDGFTIGAHSKKHQELSLLINEDEKEEEIVNSCKEIMELTGKDQVLFAFPFSGDGIDPNFLKGLISKYVFINLFFDSGDLKRDKDFIINRIPVDDPSFKEANRSNIPQHMRDAYQGHLMWKMRNILTSF